MSYFATLGCPHPFLVEVNRWRHPSPCLKFFFLRKQITHDKGPSFSWHFFKAELKSNQTQSWSFTQLLFVSRLSEPLAETCVGEYEVASNVFFSNDCLVLSCLFENMTQINCWWSGWNHQAAAGFFSGVRGKNSKNNKPFVLKNIFGLLVFFNWQ